MIQQLFAIGMSLQATCRTATGPLGERIDAAVTGLDGVIHGSATRSSACLAGAKRLLDFAKRCCVSPTSSLTSSASLHVSPFRDQLTSQYPI